MNKCDCNKPKCEPSKCRTDGFVFRKVVIPAQLGDDVTGKDIPENGAMTNSFVTYEANGAQYIYDSFGVYTKFTGENEVPVLSVNGKTGRVVLTTSDLENDSDYVTGTYVDEAISGEATLREGEDERIEGKVDAVADDLEAEATARSDADRQLLTAIGDETTARQRADNNLQSQIDAITASSDVTDIVGTYAELQAYDTSTLGDKDIIKVLQDESQNDETTYYRWSTATQTFTLIGEEGPYYTKSAADTKFQDKLTEGANITINANNEISATDTTYSDFTGTDGTASGTSGLVPAPSALDIDKYLKSDGTWGAVAAGPTVVQSTGTSTTDVMSQAAASQMIYPSGYETSKSRININGTISASSTAGGIIAIRGTVSGPRGVAIGLNSEAGSSSVALGVGPTTQQGPRARTMASVAIGADSLVSQGEYSVALGSDSQTTRDWEVSVGGRVTNRHTRYIANVTDPQLAQDAATKNYVDGKLPTVLTTADYDYPSGSPDSIAVWDLAAGEYKAGEDILLNRGASNYNKFTLSAGGTLFVSKKGIQTCAVVIGRAESNQALRPAVWFYSGSTQSTAPQEYTQGAVLTTDTLTSSLTNTFNGYAFDSRGAKTLNETKLSIANLEVGEGLKTTTTGTGANTKIKIELDSATMDWSSIQPGTGYGVASTRVDKKGGVVYFSGSIQVPAITSIDNQTDAFILPVGWRPTTTVNFCAIAYTSADPTPLARVRIGTDGTVRISKISQDIPANTYVQVSGITFVAA